MANLECWRAALCHWSASRSKCSSQSFFSYSLSLSFYIYVDVCVCGSLSLLDYLSLVALHATGWVPAVETTFRSQDNGTVCPATKMTPNTEQTLLGTVAQSLRIELERNIFSCITFVEKNIGRKRERERCFFPNIEEMSNSGRPYLCDPRKSQERCRKIRKSYTSNTYTYQGWPMLANGIERTDFSLMEWWLYPPGSPPFSTRAASAMRGSSGFVCKIQTNWCVWRET